MKRIRQIVSGGALAAALVLGSTPPATSLFLDAVFCEIDPLYDNCLVTRLKDYVLSGDGATPGITRDRSLVTVFVGYHLDHRTDGEKLLSLPDPDFYIPLILSDSLEQVIRVVHYALFRDDFTGAEDVALAIDDDGARRLALRYLAEAHLRYGDPAAAGPLLDLLQAEINGIQPPPARIESLGALAWLYALADNIDGARAAVDEIIGIGSSHPLSQLRPIFSQEAAAAEGLIDGIEAGRTRVEAALTELRAMSNLPPGFLPETLAVSAKNFGRLGLYAEGRAIAAEALAMSHDVDPDRRGEFFRNLIEAGFVYE